MSRNCSTPETSWSPIWRSRRRRCQPVGGPTRPAPPPRAPHHPSASYDAAPRKGARPPGTGAWSGAAVAGHRPPVRRGSRTGHRYEPARDRGTRGDGAGQRRRTRGRPGPGCGCMPEVTDKLSSDRAAHRAVMPSVAHRTDRYANNRAEVSHQPTRQHERQMRRFKSAAQAQRFLSVHGLVLNLFRVGRHLLRSAHHRLLRRRAFAEWDAVTCAC